MCWHLAHSRDLIALQRGKELLLGIFDVEVLFAKPIPKRRVVILLGSRESRVCVDMVDDLGQMHLRDVLQISGQRSVASDSREQLDFVEIAEPLHV